MIATLKEASLQDIFDQVVTHLLKQNKQALAPNGACKYHTDSGLKCAVGCLISDDEYYPDMDNGLSISKITGLCYTNEKYKLLSRLQLIHDRQEPRY